MLFVKHIRDYILVLSLRIIQILMYYPSVKKIMLTIYILPIENHNTWVKCIISWNTIQTILSFANFSKIFFFLPRYDQKIIEKLHPGHSIFQACIAHWYSYSQFWAVKVPNTWEIPEKNRYSQVFSRSPWEIIVLCVQNPTLCITNPFISFAINKNQKY